MPYQFLFALSDGYEDRPELFKFKLGTYDYRNDNEPGEVVADVARIYKHPQYGYPHEFSHDISIIRVIILF